MTLVHSTMTATPGTATPGNTYGANFQAALAASITTDQEFLNFGLSETQLMLAYGIIASDRIHGATGPPYGLESIQLIQTHPRGES